VINNKLVINSEINKTVKSFPIHTAYRQCWSSFP